MRHIECECYIRVYLATAAGRLWLASGEKKGKKKLRTDVCATCSRQICSQRQHSVSWVLKKKGVRRSSCSFKLFCVSEAFKPFHCVQGNLQPSLIRTRSHYQGMRCSRDGVLKYPLSDALTAFFFKWLLNLTVLCVFSLFPFCPTRDKENICR